MSLFVLLRVTVVMIFRIKIHQPELLVLDFALTAKAEALGHPRRGDIGRHDRGKKPVEPQVIDGRSYDGGARFGCVAPSPASVRQQIADLGLRHAIQLKPKQTAPPDNLAGFLLNDRP